MGAIYALERIMIDSAGISWPLGPRAGPRQERYVVLLYGVDAQVAETAERPHAPDGLRSFRAEANAPINKLLPGQRIDALVVHMKRID